MSRHPAVLPIDPASSPRAHATPTTPRASVLAALHGTPGILAAIAPANRTGDDGPHVHALEALAALTATASHDLANLVTEIAMSAELMAERGGHSPEDLEDLARIEAAVHRACALSRELVGLARHSAAAAPRGTGSGVVPGRPRRRGGAREADPSCG